MEEEKVLKNPNSRLTEEEQETVVPANGEGENQATVTPSPEVTASPEVTPNAETNKNAALAEDTKEQSEGKTEQETGKEAEKSPEKESEKEVEKNSEKEPEKEVEKSSEKETDKKTEQDEKKEAAKDVKQKEEEKEQDLETTTVVKEQENCALKTGILIGSGVLLGIILLFLGILVVVRRKRRKMYGYNENEITVSPGSTNGKAVKMVEITKSSPVRIASVHDVGRRSSQQDSFGISDMKNEKDLQQKGVLAIVADGMGGLTDGDRISQMVVVTMLQNFDKADGTLPPASLLLKLVHDANQEVCQDLGKEKLGKCGSTLVAVIVKDRKLSWISVGDSHIYVYRKGRLVKLNQDHIYAVELDEMVKNGELSQEEAMEDPQRGALTSYIGKGELELLDQNENPILLEKGDRILLMSDGVFGTVPETRIAEIMASPLLRACEQLDAEIRGKNKKNQDNFTCIALEVR